MSRRQQVDDLIWDLVTAGKTIRHIIKTAKVGQKRVYEVIESRRNGITEIPDKSLGRPTLLTSQLCHYIDFYTLLDAKLSNTQLKNLLYQQHSIDVSESTINRGRHLLKFCFKPPKIKQALTDDQIILRQQWLEDFKNNKNIYKNLIFTDESRFCEESDSRWVWRRRSEWNESSFATKSKFKTSIMVWGGIGVGYKSPLAIFDNSVNSQSYILKLKEINFFADLDALFGQRNWTLVQDGAPAHTSESSISQLYDVCNVLPFWPPNSCDLNPIEMLWGAMKRILKTKTIKTKKELIETVYELWDTIPQTTIDAICISFERRLELLERVGCRSIQPFISSRVSDFTRVPSQEMAASRQWSSDEDDLLLRRWHEVGSKWTTMSLYFEGRRPVELKHRVNLLLRSKRLRYPQPRLESMTGHNPLNLEVFLSAFQN